MQTHTLSVAINRVGGALSIGVYDALDEMHRVG